MVVVVVLVVAFGSGCGGEGAESAGPQSFDELVASGASCQELYDERNSWDPKSPKVEEANETLFSIGCDSSSSTRTDDGGTSEVATSDGDTSTGASQECVDAMREARDRYNEATESDFAALVTAGLELCNTADEWLAAARVYPGALGVVSDAYVDVEALEIRCYKNESTAVCKDAVATGVVGG